MARALRDRRTGAAPTATQIPAVSQDCEFAPRSDWDGGYGQREALSCSRRAVSSGRDAVALALALAPITHRPRLACSPEASRS